MKISLVVATSDNNAIGYKGQLLWNLPDDMRFFKNITKSRQVLMGRKSWEALPPQFRPLPGRTNIVVTRQQNYQAEGAKVVKTIGEGIQQAKDGGETELMIIGGGEIYRQAMPLADKIYITRVHHVFEQADAFFPDISPRQWKETSREKRPADEKHRYAFDFVEYKRMRAG